MKKKTKVSFTISEHTKILIDKLARDKNLSKSKLIEEIIFDYFDSKKDDLLIEKMNDTIEELHKDFKDLNYKTRLIIDKISDFNIKNLAAKIAEILESGD